MAKSKVAINFEYGVLRFFCALVNAIPYRVAMALARGLARLFFDVFRFKRARTLARIHTVFPQKSAAECAAIARDSLTNILQMGVELIRAPYFTRAWMDRYVLDGPVYKDRLQALVNEGHGVVIMVPHSGNWFMAAWSIAKYGLPMIAIGARQRNPKVSDWMYRQYGDLEVLSRDDKSTLIKIHDKLRAGRAFAIMPDLRVRHKDTLVPFLGGDANVSHAGAMFAVRSACPIVVAAMRRENGKHVFNHIATLRPDPNAKDAKEESRRLTREAMVLLDKEVQAHPGDWFWFNKRWILESVHD